MDALDRSEIPAGIKVGSRPHRLEGREGNDLCLRECDDGIRCRLNHKRFAHLPRFPQYVEAPPNIEAERTISCFSTVLSS